jgi:hypothetical protein
MTWLAYLHNLHFYLFWIKTNLLFTSAYGTTNFFHLYCVRQSLAFFRGKNLQQLSWDTKKMAIIFSTISRQSSVSSGKCTEEAQQSVKKRLPVSMKTLLNSYLFIIRELILFQREKRGENILWRFLPHPEVFGIQILHDKLLQPLISTSFQNTR